MKKIIAIAAGIIVIAVSGYLVFGKNQNVRNVPLKNDKIVVFGDSLAEGVGATDGGDLVSLLGKKTGKAVINHGKSGDTTRDALGRVASALEEEPGMVLIILGGNDVLKKIPKEETFQNLDKIIGLFQDSGAAVVLVGVRSGLVGDGRGDDYEKLAQKTQSLYMSDILSDVFGKKEFMSDLVHPNDAGYAIIGKRLASIIVQIPERR